MANHSCRSVQPHSYVGVYALRGWRMGGVSVEGCVCCVTAVGIWFGSLLLFV